MPSSVFRRMALERLDDGSPSEDEKARRQKYIDEVVTQLSVHQAHYIEEHYKRSIIGHIADFFTALIIASLIGGLFYTYGFFHPLALGLVALLGVKLLFLFFSVRRMIKIARNTFAAQTMSIVLPWLGV